MKKRDYTETGKTHPDRRTTHSASPPRCCAPAHPDVRGSTPHRGGARSRGGSAAHTQPRGAWRPGLSLFTQNVLEHAVIERQLPDRLLQLCILALKRLDSSGFRYIHATELVAPAVESLLGDVVLPTKIVDIPDRHHFLQNPDNRSLVNRFLFMSPPVDMPKI